MAFFYVYKALAHPEKDGYIQPFTLEERLAHIADAKRKHDTRIPWLADSMTNDLKHAFGNRNNSEFVVSPEGKVLVARDWSNPNQLRSDLEEFVGKADTLTKVSDLDRNPEREKAKDQVARGVVPRQKRPADAIALVTRTVAEGEEREPFFVKLRAEASRSVLKGGKGQLYLGFHLDPIHKVHWNNLAAPLKYRITAPEGITIHDLSGEAPKVKDFEADRDPREFLVEVDSGSAKLDEPLRLRVDYFACDDGDRWCKAVSQEYEIEWRQDRDAGRVQGGGGERSRRPGQGGRNFSNPGEFLSRLDSNEDGKVSRDEARGPMVQRFDQMDMDGDGFVSGDEIRKRFEAMRGGSGGEARRRKRPPLE